MERTNLCSTVVEASGGERRDPDVEMVGSGLPSGRGGEAPRDEGARESTRTGTEGVVERPSSLGQENPCKRRQKMPKRDEV